MLGRDSSLSPLNQLIWDTESQPLPDPTAGMLPVSSSVRHAYVLVLLINFPSFLSAKPVPSDELEPLLKFKASMEQLNTSIVLGSWISKNSVCNFTGITCNSGHFVTDIELSNRNLTGRIPLRAICRLRYLTKLSLGFNSLHGTVTDDLNTCTELRYLDLGNNFFSGPFPDISYLNQLHYLFLNQTGISGVFPWKSLANMTGLRTLSTGDNPFVATPFPVEVLKLTKLQYLYLSNCSIGGKIPPSIGNLTELVLLELADNLLYGHIPWQITNLQKLVQLELYNNNLTGKLPAGFGNLTGLMNLDLSSNSLQGDLSELRFLKNLVSLQLFQNEFSGQVPVELGEFKKLVNLSLYRNQLNGSLPSSLGSWAEFGFIDASENHISGSIPPGMCQKGTMKLLLLLQNNLTGEIPASYVNCTTLKRFRVSKNSLSGHVPAGIWGLPQLNIIDIESNHLEGSVTSRIQHAKALAQLFAGYNLLSGEIPLEICQASSLVSIELNNNRFSGNVPDTLGKLKQLGSLHLENNLLTGSIPESLGSCHSLNDLNMAGNLLSAEIPASLGSLPSLNSLNLSENNLCCQIPESLSSSRLSLLDLSHNELVGRVPQSLSIEAYSGSFVGNPGLCSETLNKIPRCSRKISVTPRTLIIALLAGSLLLLTSLAFFLFIKYRETDEQKSLMSESSWDVKYFHLLSFCKDEILNSISQENLIGRGGSGNVYRVVLSDGKEVAVKHVWDGEANDGMRSKRTTTPKVAKLGEKSKEYDSEVQSLSCIRHVNVVKMYCTITGEGSSFLVYEYMQNGSLWDRLHVSKKMELSWETRYEIAMGAAKGLQYLHHGCGKPMIHRDIKSSNILLDEFMKPRIADFGLAKILQANLTKDSSTHVVAGTHGYIAPEYGYTYKVNEKSDVYSFGVVLMELVSGKKPIELEYGEDKDIVDWVSSKLKKKENKLSIVDSRIPQVFIEGALEVLRVAILCTAKLPAIRPTMRRVVLLLEEAEPCKLASIVAAHNPFPTKKNQVAVLGL